MEASGRISLQLFGMVRTSRAGQPVHMGSASARAIVAYLALSPEYGADRGRLAGLFWENSDKAHARQNLRQTLLVIDRAFGPRWKALIADRHRVALSSPPVTDQSAIFDALERGQVPGDLMDGTASPEQLLIHEPSRGNLFESWLRLQRNLYEERLTAALSDLLMSGSPDTARQAAQSLIKINPTDERAVRHLMSHFNQTGQIARALGTYETLWNTLQTDFDSEPSAETQELIVAIKTQSSLPPQTTNPAAGRSNTAHLRIGVAPSPLSGDMHADSVAKLFRAELIATLLRFRGFELIDRGRSTEPVDYLMELSVGQDGQELLLLCSVTAAADGAMLWSERWRGIGSTWLATQASVVSRLSSSLSLEVSRAHLRRISKTPFSTSAFDAWIEGNSQLDLFRSDSLQRARACFEQVVSRAPEASFGYSSLARTLNSEHLMQPGLFRKSSTHLAAKEIATQAVAIDPLDSRAHLHRAWACCLAGEYDQASFGFEIARDCNPNDPWTLLSSGLGEAFSGNVRIAQRLSARVISEGWTVMPFQWGFHAPIRFLAGDMAGCAEAGARGGDAIINLPAWQAAAEWCDGNADSARSSWAMFEELARKSWIGDLPPQKEDICDWFLSCFPIRSAQGRERLAAGARGAAGL